MRKNKAKKIEDYIDNPYKKCVMVIPEDYRNTMTKSEKMGINCRDVGLPKKRTKKNMEIYIREKNQYNHCMKNKSINHRIIWGFFIVFLAIIVIMYAYHLVDDTLANTLITVFTVSLGAGLYMLIDYTVYRTDTTKNNGINIS